MILFSKQCFEQPHPNNEIMCILCFRSPLPAFTHFCQFCGKGYVNLCSCRRHEKDVHGQWSKCSRYKAVTLQTFEFVQFNIAEGVKFIVLLELLPRLGQYECFNDKVNEVNDLIHMEKKDEQYKNVYLWEHSWQNFNTWFLYEFVEADGTHVNGASLVKFYMSIRGAILWTEKQTSQLCI